MKMQPKVFAVQVTGSNSYPTHMYVEIHERREVVMHTAAAEWA